MVLAKMPGPANQLQEHSDSTHSQSHTSALSPTLSLNPEALHPQPQAHTAGHRGAGLCRELEPHHRHCPKRALGRGDCL